MALSGAIGFRLDPVLGYNFLITLIDTSSKLATTLSVLKAAVFDVALGGFTECTGLEMSLDVEEFREGGRNSEMLVFPKMVKWSKITMKKGVGASTDLWDWHYGFVEGKGKRRDGLIILLNDLHVPNNIWYFRRGLPTRYSGPSMNAGQGNVAIEAIEITHEGIYQVPFVGLGAGAVTSVASAVV